MLIPSLYGFEFLKIEAFIHIIRGSLKTIAKVKVYPFDYFIPGYSLLYSYTLQR